MEEILTYHSIYEFNNAFDIETLHPLIHVTEMENENPVEITRKHSFDFYQVFLQDTPCGNITYGQNAYDYQDGTLLFFAPRQVISVDNPQAESARGWVLMFHADLLKGTPLGHNLHGYTFFSYDVNEALHLSAQEREIILNCFRNLRSELQHAADNNSKSLIISNLELLLNYCKRFYERQFITRAQVNTDTLSRFERILDDYFGSKNLRRQGLPTVKYCADKMFFSANYLSDLLRKETGRSAQEHIQMRLVDMAKERLLFDVQKSVSEIAYDLGFEYPQYFSRLFKKRVGMTPNEYRTQN